MYVMYDGEKNWFVLSRVAFTKYRELTPIVKGISPDGIMLGYEAMGKIIGELEVAKLAKRCKAFWVPAEIIIRPRS